MASVRESRQVVGKAFRKAFSYICLKPSALKPSVLKPSVLKSSVKSVFIGMMGSLVLGSSAIAENLPIQLSDIDRFPLFLPASQGQVVAASSSLSLTEISQPSLIWIEDQLGNRYGSDRLVQQWQAYQTAEGFQYVDVVVNESIWNLLSYFERYGFILQFGTAAKSYGYNLRVFHSGDVVNRQEVIGLNRVSRSVASRSIALRGAYLCDFSDLASQADALAAEIPCHILLDASSSRRLGRQVF